MTAQVPMLTQDEIDAKYTMRHRTAKYTCFRMDLTALLRHRCYYTPFGCHVGCAFEALRWMYGLGGGRDGREVHPILQIFSHDSGTVPWSGAKIELGTGWRTHPRAGLPGMFDMIVLQEERGAIEKWRQQHRLQAHTAHTVSVPSMAVMRETLEFRGSRGGWFGGSMDAQRTIDRLVGYTGQLSFSPNDCHPDARSLYRVVLHLRTWPQPSWEVLGGYDFPNDSGSTWTIRVCAQHPKEAFPWFVERALDQVRRMCGDESEEADGGRL